MIRFSGGFIGGRVFVVLVGLVGGLLILFVPAFGDDAIAIRFLRFETRRWLGVLVVPPGLLYLWNLLRIGLARGAAIEFRPDHIVVWAVRSWRPRSLPRTGVEQLVADSSGAYVAFVHAEGALTIPRKWLRASDLKEWAE